MLEKARELINKSGYHALNLPELAKFSGYSKPTIYKYFPNKEDLMVALAVESAGRQIAHFERAITFNGRPREKIHGIYSLNTGPLREASHDFLLIHTNNIRSRATQERQNLLDRYEEQRIEIIAGIMREAIESGDLKLPKRITEYELVFTMMATSMGGYLLQESDSPVTRQWFEKINFTHKTFGQTVLDGINWHPLTGEWDYFKTIKRFYHEVFPELNVEERKFAQS
jgi:AcrR family transcriptional regulator